MKEIKVKGGLTLVDVAINKGLPAKWKHGQVLLPGVIVRLASEAVGVDAKRIFDGDRHHRVSMARAIACYYMMKMGYSYTNTARAIGVDRSSVYYACHRVQGWIDEGGDAAEWIREFERQLIIECEVKP